MRATELPENDEEAISYLREQVEGFTDDMKEDRDALLRHFSVETNDATRTAFVVGMMWNEHMNHSAKDISDAAADVVTESARSAGLPTMIVKLARDDAFNQAIHEGLPEGGDVELITKDAGTQNGRAVACITFTVEVNGEHKRAQTVTSVRNLLTALTLLQGRYDEDGKPRKAPAN